MNLRVQVSPVLLAASASGAVLVASLILYVAVPGLGPSHVDASRWNRLLLVEAACAIPLFFVYKHVRRAEWLWPIWLIALLDYSFRDIQWLWRSAYSLVVVAVYLSWSAKLVVAAILLLHGNRPVTLEWRKKAEQGARANAGIGHAAC